MVANGKILKTFDEITYKTPHVKFLDNLENLKYFRKFCCIEEEEAAAYLIDGSGFVEIYESGFESLFIKSSISSDEFGGIAS